MATHTYIITYTHICVYGLKHMFQVLLPMPLVVLDPKFGLAAALFAFGGPLLVGLAAKDVLEPLVIGKSTSLSPVAVLMAIMLWGSVWGVTGMVLAVPMTAVARIYLASVEHPLL